MVDPITNTTNTTYQPEGTGKSTLGKDDFMKLMITQLKYQDPMNPADSTQFSAQLAQFSSLEQLSNLNDNMTKSIDSNYVLTQSINNTMTANLIGKEVKLSGNGFTNVGQDDISLGFNLSDPPLDTTVTIYNEAGQAVRTINDGSFKAGDNKLSWDFTDNDGNKVPDGKYTFKVEAEGVDKNGITVTTFMNGLISGVKFTDQGTVLLVNGGEAPLSDIIEIIKPSDTTTGGN